MSWAANSTADGCWRSRRALLGTFESVTGATVPGDVPCGGHWSALSAVAWTVPLLKPDQGRTVDRGESLVDRRKSASSENGTMGTSTFIIGRGTPQASSLAV